MHHLFSREFIKINPLYDVFSHMPELGAGLKPIPTKFTAYK